MTLADDRFYRKVITPSLSTVGLDEELAVKVTPKNRQGRGQRAVALTEVSNFLHGNISIVISVQEAKRSSTKVVQTGIGRCWTCRLHD